MPRSQTRGGDRMSNLPRGMGAAGVTKIGLLQKARSEKVTENEVLLAKQEIEFARFLEKGHDVSPAKTEAVNQARKTPLGVREAADEIETVGQLLEAAKMACGDLPSDAIAPCERFSRLSKWFARPGPGSKEMSASSSRPHQWPASTFRPGRLALCERCFASPQEAWRGQDRDRGPE